jgi:hypothetical protein
MIKSEYNANLALNAAKGFWYAGADDTAKRSCNRYKMYYRCRKFMTAKMAWTVSGWLM